MQAYQLFQAISPELKTEIFERLYTAHRPAFNLVLGGLAQSRKLRPIFLQQKAKEDQFKWMADLLKVKPNNSLAEQVLQLWLLKGQQKMLGTFLDAVGIPHKDGEVENLPGDISEEKGKAGLDALLAEFPADKVAVYMSLFQGQRPGGWSGLAAAIAAEPRLKLGA